MSHENISININNDIDDIDDDNNNDLKNEINKLDNKNVDDVDNHVHIHKPAYIDKPIIEVSPNGEYLVVYNPEDQSIVGWNAKNIEEGQLTKSDAPVKVNDSKDKKTEISDSKDQITEISDSKDQITEISDSKIQVTEISVSDDKKLACSFNKDNECCLKIIDIDHKDQEIRLNLGGGAFTGSRHHTFNSKGKFILYSNWKIHDELYYEENKIIRIFSTQTINNKWYCERIYKIPEYFELINISKYADILYLFSNNSIYEWDLDAEKGIKIFCDRELKSHCNKRNLKHDIKISSNEMFICLSIMNKKFIIYSIESAIPIFSLDLENDTSIYNLELLPLLPSLFPLLSSNTQDSIIKHCWEECLNRLRLKGKILQNLPSSVQTTDKYAFGILDGDVWKIKLEENIPKINFSSQNSDVQVIEDINDHFDEYLNINLFKSYMNKIRELFQEVSNSKIEYEGKLKRNDQNLVERIIITDKLLQVWKIKIIDNNKIMLRVFKKADISSKWKLTYTRITKFNVSDVRNIKLLEIKLFTDDDIILITTIGFLIYHYNENKKTIFLIYWNYMELTTPMVNLISEIPEDFKDLKALLRPYYTLQFNLPLPNYDSFKISDEWISYVKDNKENLLKYGDKLLSFAIKEHKLDLIEEIYKKCIDWFKEDLGNNWMFLSIISSTMPLLNKHYPEYVLRYSLETTMIIDHPFYNIEYQHTKSQLYSFQYLQLVDLTRSILWLKYYMVLFKFHKNHKTMYLILKIIQLSILFVMILIPPIFLIYIVMFYILDKCHFISNIGLMDLFSNIYNALLYKLTTRDTPTITFIVPYIKFINYPQRYNWFSELIKPQPSPFVETTMNRDIYNTWNGEAIINFKWNTYGKYYYSIIWIGFIALLGCFTAAATIPQQYIDDDIRKKLLIASIVFGFIHLSFEVRQFIYNPLKWVSDFWNIFDIIAYVLPIYTSIYWLQIDEMNDKIISLLSFSCLFLDIKFLLFFRALEYFGVFAHAFFILLLPRSDFSLDNRSINNDPNNPWNMASTYNQIFENGTIDSNPFLIQPPNENTNMFIDFKTSLFATYLFLTGDSGALSNNWSYLNNPPLVILIVLFSLLIVVYLMNLFIGLLSNAIEKNNNRVSYLKLKAQILAEIELFYLLPHQRRWKTWFPEIIYYYANFDDIRKEVKAMMDRGEWNTNAFPELKNDLLNKLNIQQNTAQ
ncbi:hypothetical protein RhiirA1_528989 [Rhizophagus irregularis]|uniref:Ion transport domain-containing protein n=1 Tax=Rhizophagus irregularis TaxID=588596 RepID=A0A2N0SHY6_9GLOM|nr:hypothetical protein RhiirA1_528989 [Rhizophagus irregularis]